MPTGICTADGVALVSADIVAVMACVVFDQDITYLVP
jgi:hypothetical protein